jgi:hypothetical protein
MRRLSLLVAAAGLVLFSAMPASAQNGAKVGLLTCNMSPTIGLIVGSHQRIHCRFTRDAGGPPEAYTGSITRIGLDVGFRSGGTMAWAVFAPTSGLHHGALRGNYVGASGDASFGLGAGPNCWSAARTERSRCNRSPCRGRRVSTLRWASPASGCAEAYERLAADGAPLICPASRDWCQQDGRYRAAAVHAMAHGCSKG